MIITYDGVALFGYAVKARMEVNPSAEQVNEFFGASGTQSLFGGTRGRIFLVSGLLVGSDNTDLQNQIALILSYDDGIGRVFSHEVYGSWGLVVFRRFVPADKVLPGPCLEYKAQFDGRV